MNLWKTQIIVLIFKLKYIFFIVSKLRSESYLIINILIYLIIL